MADSGGGGNAGEEEDASSGSKQQQGVLDVSDKKTLSPKELKRWRLFNVVLDGQGTPEDIQKDKPFQRLHNFVVYRGHSGQVMAWPDAKPTIKPYHGSKLRVEGEVRRMASYKSGRKEEVSMRVVAGVRRFAVDVRRGEQRGIWIEGKDVWFLLQAPRPDFAPLMRCYKSWCEKLVLAYDTYLVLEHLELQRLQKEGRVGPSQVALSQLFNRTDLDLPPLTKADGPEGLEEASYLFKIIQPATQTDDEADEKKGGKATAVVQFFNDYAKVRKGHRKGGGGASEDDASCMSEMSTNLVGASAQHESIIPARATLPSEGLAAAAAAAAAGDVAAEAQEGGRMSQGNVLTAGGLSLPVEVATGKKRKKVVALKEEEEQQQKEKKEGEEDDDDDDMNMQQILARVKAASPSTVPAPTAPPTGAAAASRKEKASEKGGEGGMQGVSDDGYVIPKKKPKLADGGRGGGGRGSGVGSIKGEGNLADAHPTNTADDAARVFPPSSLPSSFAAPSDVPASVAAPAVPEAVSARLPSSVSSNGTCAPNELKQRLKVLKRPHAALAPVDVPFFLQAWGQIMGKDRQRVLEALARSSDAVRAVFRCGGGLGGLVYWLHDQMSPRALGSQERKVLQGESGGALGSSSGSAAEIFIQMLRLIQGLVDATANTGWDVEVAEWRASQAGPVLADVEERLAPHTLDGIGGEEGKGEGSYGVWPHEAKVVATGIVHTIRAALAVAGRNPTPQERAHLASHPPEKPSVVVPPAHVGGGSQHPARASQADNITTAGKTAAFGALAAVTESRRNREGLRVSFKRDDELLQVHNYKSLEVAADEQAWRRAISLLDVKTANEYLEKGSTCFVS